MNVPTFRLKSHHFRTLSPTYNPHSTLSTIKMSIARPTSRNFHSIYSANNPIGVSFFGRAVLTQSVNTASAYSGNDNPIGLVSQNAPIYIRVKLERPTLRGCFLVTNYGRVVALLQHLPCQRTKPKGLPLCVLPYRPIL